MTDFYGGEGESNGFPPGGFPGGENSIMMAGSASKITDFDGWFLRYLWTKIRDEEGRFDLSSVTPVTTTTTTTTTTKPPETTTTTTSEIPTTSTTTIVDDFLYGDANTDGKVDISDAVMILQAIANKEKYGLTGNDPTHITESGWRNADCSSVGDGVTTKDALAVQKYIIDLITLPEQ